MLNWQQMEKLELSISFDMSVLRLLEIVQLYLMSSLKERLRTSELSSHTTRIKTSTMLHECIHYSQAAPLIELRR